MSTSQKRDAGMDRLLRAVLKPAPQSGPGDCPDASVLAAFVERGLTATEESALEAHIAGCGRCQEALSVLSHDLPEEAAAEAAAPETRWFTWVTRPRLRWLVPISAAATVAVLVFATRPLIAPENEEVFPSDVVQMAQAPPPPAAMPAAGLDAPREKSAAVPERSEPAASARRDAAAESQVGQAQVPKASREALADEKRTQQTAPAPAPPPAALQTVAVATPPPGGQMAVAQQAANVPEASDAGRRRAAAELDRGAGVAGAPAKLAPSLDAGLVTVSAPGGEALWRFGSGGRLSRSVDGGASWQPQTSGAQADLRAGAAPSPSVCWIVGSAGTVLLTTGGERWERRPFPLSVDLVAIEASSARAATVTTRDGRRFETLDAGLTWLPKQ